MRSPATLRRGGTHPLLRGRVEARWDRSTPVALRVGTPVASCAGPSERDRSTVTGGPVCAFRRWEDLAAVPRVHGCANGLAQVSRLTGTAPTRRCVALGHGPAGRGRLVPRVRVWSGGARLAQPVAFGGPFCSACRVTVPSTCLLPCQRATLVFGHGCQIDSRDGCKRGCHDGPPEVVSVGPWAGTTHQQSVFGCRPVDSPSVTSPGAVPGAGGDWQGPRYPPGA